MRIYYSITYIFGTILLLSFPIVVFGQGLVPCDGVGDNPCNLDSLVQMINNIINFALRIAPFLAAIAFAIAGFYYFTSAGSEQKISRAHEIFQNTFIGIVVVLAAWLIVKAILAGLGAENFVSQLFG